MKICRQTGERNIYIRTVTLLLFLLCTIGNISAQTGSIKIKKPKPETTEEKDTLTNSVSSFEVYYGCKSFFENFQNKFNTTGEFDLNRPVQLVGIGQSGRYLVQRNDSFYGHLLYSQVVPQPLQINDSINCKVTGFVFGLAMGAALHTRSEKFYTLFYAGFNTGRLRFYENEIVRQKNPFFSPKIGIQPKILIGLFTLTFIAEAEYDISKTSWRRMNIANRDKITIDRFRQSGITTMVGISYRIFHYRTGSFSDKPRPPYG